MRLKKFSIYSANDNDLDGLYVVEEKFSIFAFIFGVFWLAYKNLWLAFFIFLAADLLIIYLANFVNQPAIQILSLAKSFFIAINASWLLEKKYISKGAKYMCTIYAYGPEEAKIKFIDEYKTLS